MALTKWKQIDGDLSGSRVLTGSLELSGSFNIQGSISASSSITGSDVYIDGFGSISSSLETISASAAQTPNLATNSNNTYVDFGATDSAYRIPMIVGTSDGYYQLKSPSNEVYYYYRATNPVSGVSQQADYITIGGGANTAGGVFLNSTVGIPSFVYSDGPLHLYSTAYKVEISSSDHVSIAGETKITGSVNISGDLDVAGVLTAREFHTEYVSASIIYESGSTKFGDTSDDVHQFTGSIYGTNQIWVDQYRFNNRDSDYIYSVSDGQFGFRTVEGLSWFMSRTEFGAYRTDGPSLMRAAATSTVPTLVPNGWADENTGIGWNGADSMAFIAGGTNVMNVSGSKVGIGTTAPQAELHVEGDISGSGNVTITRSDSTEAVFTLNTDRSFGRPFTITNNGQEPTINAQDILRIQADDGAAEIKLDASGQDYISFITNNSEAVRINSARNVGIGTTSPTEKLTVEGNISGSGTINVASSITGSDVKIDDWGSISASLASISNISTGLGIVDLDDSNDITVSIDTGSAHFINGVLKSGVFRQTGSYFNTTNFLQITGSLTVESNDEIPFEITSGSKRRFAVQHDGVLSLVTQSTTPTAIVGGLYLDNSYNIFIGQE